MTYLLMAVVLILTTGIVYYRLAVRISRIENRIGRNDAAIGSIEVDLAKLDMRSGRVNA